MADQESKPQPPLTDNTDSSPVKTTGKKTLPLILANFAIIIAILSVLSQFYFWESHKKIFADLRESISNLMRRADNTQRNLVQLKKEIRQLQTTTPSLQTLNMESEVLMRQAEYLVTLAHYNLIFETNSDVAIHLLETADTIIKQSTEPSLIDVRKALAENIIALKTLPAIDVPGLVLRINALSDQVLALSQKTLPTVIKKPAVVATQPKTWREKLAASLDEIKGLISIRRLNQPVKPLLSSEQQFYLLENIRLQLTQAQWAVLHRDQKLYSQGLDRAMQLIQLHYGNSPDAAKLQQIIAELRTINLTPNLPNLTKTIEMIQSAAKNLQTKNLTNIPPTTGTIIQTQPGNLPSSSSPSLPSSNPGTNSINPAAPNPLPRAMPS